MSNKPSRRAVVRTGVWAVPAVAMAASAPAFAGTGGGNTVVTAVAQKCPGQSSQDDSTFWTTIVTLTFTDPVHSLVVAEATLNDNTWDNPPVMVSCDNNKVRYVVLQHDDSEHGGGTVTYLVNNQAPQTVAVYFDNHPLHGYPCSGGC